MLPQLPDQPATVEIPAGTAVYRIHRAANSPAFFDTGPDRRFNPPVGWTSTFGTIYLALDPPGAFLETLGRVRTMTNNALAERRLSTATFRHVLRLFDVASTTNRFHAGFDLADEAIATSADYRRPRELAAVVHTEGFDGLFYPARHDNSTVTRSIAVFGPPGAHTPEDGFATWNTATIPDELVDEMVRRYRFEVLPDVPLP